jgi:hypothetical protein
MQQAGLGSSAVIDLAQEPPFKYRWGKAPRLTGADACGIAVEHDAEVRGGMVGIVHDPASAKIAAAAGKEEATGIYYVGAFVQCLSGAASDAIVIFILLRPGYRFGEACI